MLGSSARFVVRQREFVLSECERLCRRPSREILELAAHCGPTSIPGEPLRIPVGAVLNMLLLSIAATRGLERHVMTPWLPGLREEAMLQLGQSAANWTFVGPHEAEKHFWPILYGSSDTVRPRIAGMLGCYAGSTTRELRFFSSSDVEIVSNGSCGQTASSRTPLFTIDAHDLVARLSAVSGTPLFTAQAVEAS